jgi:peptidoglycan hydrolase CwlO-like protein
MTDMLSWIAMILSGLTLFISYLAYKNKVNAADNKQWTDQIRALKETELKALQEKAKEVHNNITELYRLCNNTHTELSVLQERIDNEINMLEKLERKLDEIQEELRK